MTIALDVDALLAELADAEDECAVGPALRELQKALQEHKERG